MTARAFDWASYDRLLIAFKPRVPRGEKENQRLIRTVYLAQKYVRSPELDELIKMLLVLIEEFEEAHYPMKANPPHIALRELMLNHDAKPKDLYEIFGSKGSTSEVLNGKRAISKAAAKKLAKRFHAPVEIFI